MKLLSTTLALLFALAIFSNAQAQTAPKKGLTLEGAKKVIGAAAAEAKKLNAPGGGRGVGHGVGSIDS